MFCSNCGNNVADGTKFCQNCGTNIGGQAITPTVDNNTQAVVHKEITGNLVPIQSKIHLDLLQGEVPIAQYSAAFVKSSIAQGTLTLTNKRILFTKDGAGKAFFKRGGLLGMAMSSGANIPSSISLDNMMSVHATSCIQGKAAFIIIDRTGSENKIALQSMNPAKTKELCEARDRIVSLISGALKG